MIKVFSGVEDWNFGSRVEEWLESLGSNYEVYDCAITSSYDSDARETYVTAVFFYGAIKTNFKIPDKEVIRHEVNEADKELTKKFLEESFNTSANLKQNFINHNYSNKIKTDYAELKNSLNKMFDELEDMVVDKSEPYARGKMRR